MHSPVNINKNAYLMFSVTIKKHKMTIIIFLTILALDQRLTWSDLPVSCTEIFYWKLHCSIHYLWSIKFLHLFHHGIMLFKILLSKIIKNKTFFSASLFEINIEAFGKVSLKPRQQLRNCFSVIWGSIVY